MTGTQTVRRTTTRARRGSMQLLRGLGAAMLTIVFLFLMPAFLCVGLMALALARLIHRAALLREDNELTV